MKPMVFASAFPSEAGDYENLRESLGKLQLNDPSLGWEPETSQALGYGFPLWLPGPVPHGDRAGTPGARV